MTLAVLKILFKKQKRSLELLQEYVPETVSHKTKSCYQDNSWKGFQEKCRGSNKTKIDTGNQASFMNKELQQVIIIRSKLINSQMFIKNKSLIDKMHIIKNEVHVSVY